MNDLTEPLPTAVHGLRTAFDGIERAFGNHEAALASMSFINTFLNAAIGLLITVAIVTLFAYLMCWVFAKSDTTLHTNAVRGTFRSGVAIFLMVNIWGIMYLINQLVLLSDVTAYGIFFFALLILGFWSLFGAGDALVSLLSRASHAIADYGIAAVRRTGFARYSDDTVKFGIFLALALLFTGWTFFLSTGSSSESAPRREPAESVAGSLSLIREGGDVTIQKNTYTNTRFGVTVTYPDGWEITELSDSDGLLEAYNDEINVYSRLNAGGFADIASSSEDAYLTALWRIQKYILEKFVADSGGIFSSDISSTEDVGDTKATYIRLASYWRTPDNAAQTFYDGYYILGKGPLFFTLQFQAPSEGIAFEEAGAQVQKILDSIEFSEPQGEIFVQSEEGIEDGIENGTE